MPLQEFWYNDPDLLWVYRNLYLERIKQETEYKQQMLNYQAWLQGLYNYHAIASAFSENSTYLEKPIELNVKPKTKQEQNLEIAQRIKERAIKGKMILQQRSENKG